MTRREEQEREEREGRIKDGQVASNASRPLVGFLISRRERQRGCTTLQASGFSSSQERQGDVWGLGGRDELCRRC